jgi:hypothetical protein
MSKVPPHTVTNWIPEAVSATAPSLQLLVLVAELLLALLVADPSDAVTTQAHASFGSVSPMGTDAAAPGWARPSTVQL